jgi:hypothetical protein
VLLHPHCLLFGVLGWVSVQHFELSADLKGLYKYIRLIDCDIASTITTAVRHLIIIQKMNS